MSEEIYSAAGLLARIEALTAERDRHAARAEILAAQVLGWAAQCAAQVQAAQAYLDAQADIPHTGRAIGARVRLAHTIETDASRALLAALAAANSAVDAGQALAEGVRDALDHPLPDYRRPLIESALDTYDVKVGTKRGPSELFIENERLRTALQGIRSAHGIAEMRRLAREALGEDGDA